MSGWVRANRKHLLSHLLYCNLVVCVVVVVLLYCVVVFVVLFPGKSDKEGLLSGEGDSHSRRGDSMDMTTSL